MQPATQFSWLIALCRLAREAGELYPGHCAWLAQLKPVLGRSLGPPYTCALQVLTPQHASHIHPRPPICRQASAVSPIIGHVSIGIYFHHIR